MYPVEKGLTHCCVKAVKAVSVRAQRADNDRESPLIQWQEVSWGYISDHRVAAV